MLTIKLDGYGFENVLIEAKTILGIALNTKSKRRKDELIYKTLGMVDTLQKVVIVEEYIEDEEEADNE